MTDSHEKRGRRGRVAEAAPVQVFLGHDDQDRLDRLTAQLDASKSEVLRRSLAALERELLDPTSHPALRIVGLIDDDSGVVEGEDIARAHDRYLADVNEPRTPSPKKRARRGRS